MRRHRFLFMFVGAALVFAASLYLSYALRYDFIVPDYAARDRDRMLLWVVPLKLFLLWRFRQLDALPAFFGWADVRRIAAAMLIASAIQAGLFALIGGMSAFSAPRGVILADLLLSATGLFTLRYLYTLAGRGRTERWWRDESREAVAILGANELGLHLLKQLNGRTSEGLTPVCFLDDDPAKVGGWLNDLPIVGRPEDLPRLRRKYLFERVILALPDPDPARLRTILALAKTSHCRVDLFHAYGSRPPGGPVLPRLHPPRIEDLLGRPEVRIDSARIHDMIVGRHVCVTGAGGSIGAELARQIAAHQPASLHLIERSEAALHTIETELRALCQNLDLRPHLLDLQHPDQVDALLAAHPIDLLFHSAAHKHVPITEREPLETLRNNTLATRDLACAALRHRVDRFVFISTDKAVNPGNWLGISKQLAEQCLLALQTPAAPTRMAIVRFGNVLNSSGSVVPLFRRQIESGGPVTVTHPDVERFFMSIPEAVGLILQCALFDEAGGTYVLDMGEQIRILDLARQMIELSGLRPDTDIPIVFTGLRPGEKLRETLVADDEISEETSHPGIRRIRRAEMPGPRILERLESLASLPPTATAEQIRSILSNP